VIRLTLFRRGIAKRLEHSGQRFLFFAQQKVLRIQQPRPAAGINPALANAGYRASDGAHRAK